jgi:methyltransferase (TIGR00027 family)
MRFLRFAFAVVTCVSTAYGVEPGKPSRTAVVTLHARALGTKLPDRDLRNPDSLAERFIGTRERAILAEMPGPKDLTGMDFTSAWKELPEIRRRVFLHVLARTRMIDDTLRKAIADGIQQMVVLGAGYDSRAYRFQDLLRGIAVFELDFPDTQEFKKMRVRDIMGQPPRNVKYVPIDFTQQKLREVLVKAGFREDRKTFFIWEGVTMYIPESAVNDTLQFVAENTAPGSRIIFDYDYERAIRGDHDDEVLKASMARLAAAGEAQIFGFPNDSAREFISKRGLVTLTDIGPQEMTARYLTGKTGTKLGDARWHSGIAVAEVPKR